MLLKVKCSQPPEVFYKKAVFKNFSIFTGNFYVGVSFNEKETPPQVFSCEYCNIFKSIRLEKHLRAAASDYFGCSTKLVFSKI